MKRVAEQSGNYEPVMAASGTFTRIEMLSLDITAENAHSYFLVIKTFPVRNILHCFSFLIPGMRGISGLIQVEVQNDYFCFSMSQNGLCTLYSTKM